jgi:hypothetical protein
MIVVVGGREAPKGIGEERGCVYLEETCVILVLIAK